MSFPKDALAKVDSSYCSNENCSFSESQVSCNCPVSFYLAAGQEYEPRRSSESHLKFAVTRSRWKAVCSIRLEELLSCLNVCSSTIKLCFTEFLYYGYVRLDHIKLYGQQTGAGMKFLRLCFDFHEEKE